MNKNYQAGRRFEYQVQKQYRDSGFTVLRMAGSKGPVDLVALNVDTVVCIQCKTRPPTTAEWKSLKAFTKLIPNYLSVVMAYKRHGTLHLEAI